MSHSTPPPQRPTPEQPPAHVPVLLHSVLEHLCPQTGGLYLDATFGAGGYSKGVLETPDTQIIALDRDPTAILAGQAIATKYSGRLRLVEGCFGDMQSLVQPLGVGSFDGIMLDIGVSSMQIDRAERGFSFRVDGPLDMRMSASGVSAADIVNMSDEETLANILYYYGEERASRRIARAIVHDRAHAPFTTTAALAGMIARVCPARPQDIHPATRTFQALRITVNDELGELLRALYAAESLLKPFGRLVVVSFHSLEDRIVKQFFALRSARGQAQSRQLPGEKTLLPASFHQYGKQPIVPDQEEQTQNPRARSARLRWAERGETPPNPPLPQLLALTQLPRPLNLSQKER